MYVLSIGGFSRIIFLVVGNEAAACASSRSLVGIFPMAITGGLHLCETLLVDDRGLGCFFYPSDFSGLGLRLCILRAGGFYGLTGATDAWTRDGSLGVV